MSDEESIFYGMFGSGDEQAAVLDPQRAWYLRHSTVRAFTLTLPAERTRLVRAEALLGSPARELRRLCKWLGVSATDQAVAEMMHPERSPFATLGPAGARFGADPKFLDSPKLRLSRNKTLPLDGPVPWLDGRETLSPEVVKLAKEFGYA
jgi:hypothetical protein